MAIKKDCVQKTADKYQRFFLPKINCLLFPKHYFLGLAGLWRAFCPAGRLPDLWVDGLPLNDLLVAVLVFFLLAALPELSLGVVCALNFLALSNLSPKAFAAGL
jgi:hypothetical protein